MTLYRPPQPRKPVDVKWLADLCLRHRSGQYYDVACRLAKQQKLSALDLLKLWRELREMEQRHLPLNHYEEPR